MSDGSVRPETATTREEPDSDAPARTRAPEWAPADPHAAFASFVRTGPASPANIARHPRRRRELGADAAVEGILAKDRSILAQAITVIESKAPRHHAIAREILHRCIPHSGNSVRIGITGVPGAGKSTFIEAFGQMLCRQGKRVAVLAIDPSSAVSGGSILGDKTRMELLAREPNAFIRPSPSSGTLGGVAARTRESMLLCEAAGFDTILIETVGVGQSEVAVRNMSDFFLLLQIAGAGDELQGIKKGVIEMADAIVVTKADGENKLRARTARAEYARILHYLTPFTPGWRPEALACSSLTKEGIQEIRDLIFRFHDTLSVDGRLDRQRQAQNLQWFRLLLNEAVLEQFKAKPEMQAHIDLIEGNVRSNHLPVVEAVSQVLTRASMASRTDPVSLR